MNIEQNVDLAQHSTMRLGGKAQYFCELHTKQDVVDAVEFARTKNVTLKVIGDGSNIVWSGDYNGLLAVNCLKGFTIDGTTLTVAAGENWDDTVRRTVESGLCGLENLSLIPGTVGATPVQNVGAYGSEIKDTLDWLEAYDTHSNQFVTLRSSECAFDYRTSRFNTVDKGRFIITSLQFILSTDDQLIAPLYSALESYFTENGITQINARIVREAVIAIRQSKLPDPKDIGNCGSFFKNPIVSEEVCAALLKEYPEMPHWPVENGVKLAAAWLLDTAGLKGYTDEATGMGTYHKQPLVMVNHYAKTSADLLQFKQFLVDTIQQKFGITLVQEPELI